MSLDTSIDRNSHVPYYVQVKTALVDHIDSGKWQKGSQIPVRDPIADTLIQKAKEGGDNAEAEQHGRTPSQCAAT